MQNDDILYEYWWASQEKNYHKPLKQIAQAAGGAKELFFMDKEHLAKINGITENYAEQLVYRRNNWKLYEEYTKCINSGIRFIPYYHEKYPKRLIKTAGCPYAIFVKGDLPSDDIPSVAIIGARDCSEYGRYLADKFGKELAESGVQIISGMAYGIDGLAQMAALNANGRSFGVLGCGVNHCYPKSNVKLYNRLSIQGGLISEYGLYTMPQSHLFPPRNRIISALSDVIIVIEARIKSGTSITVDMALEQGKEIGVVPGRITDSLSEGCNQLFRQGATPITCVEDILYLLESVTGANLIKNKPVKDNKKAIIESLSQDERKIYDCIDSNLKNVNWITEESGLPPQIVICSLMTLVENQLICEVSKGYYCKIE